jgi:hypothetical protein
VAVAVIVTEAGAIKAALLTGELIVTVGSWLRALTLMLTIVEVATAPLSSVALAVIG